MRTIIKKKKNIVLGILFIAIIICTPFLFGEEGCDDGLNEVANSVDQNIQNDVYNGAIYSKEDLRDKTLLADLKLFDDISKKNPYKDGIDGNKRTAEGGYVRNLEAENFAIEEIAKVKGE